MTRPPERRPALTLSDLTGDLLWPRLLTAPALALRPGCVGLGVFTLVVVWLLGSIPPLWTGGPNLVAAGAQMKVAALGDLLSALMTWDAALVRTALVDRPGAFLHANWIGVLVLALPIAAAWGVGGCAISRAAARDMAMRLSTPWPRALGFAAARWWSTLVALLGPSALVGGIALALAVAGWVLFSWPVLDVAGALAYPLMLLAGLVGSIVVVGYLMGHWLLVPAVACEGTDGIDAIQRALAYVLGRPLRLVVYLAILVVQGVVVFGVVALIAWGTITMVGLSAGALSGTRGPSVLTGVSETPLTGTASVAHAIVAFWQGLVWLIVLGFGVSYTFASSTVLYLLMRQLNDGQSCEDLWTPGTIEGVLARAESA